MLRKKNLYVDPLTNAEETVAQALSVFDVAAQNLEAAISLYDTVAQDSEDSAHRLLARAAHAAQASEQNAKVLDKIRSLTA